MITYQSLATDFKHKKFLFRSWAYILTCEKPICSKHLEQVNNWCDTMWPNQIINYLCPPRYLNIQFVHLNLDLKKLNVFYETDSIGRFWCTAMYSLKSKHVQKMVIRTVTEEVYTVHSLYTVVHSVSSNSLSRVNDGDMELSSSFAHSWSTMISNQIFWCQIFQVSQPKMAGTVVIWKLHIRNGCVQPFWWSERISLSLFAKKITEIICTAWIVFRERMYGAVQEI